MANYSSYYSQTQKSFSSFVVLLIFCFLLLLSSSSKVNSAEIVSFEFPKFQKGQDNLIFQGDAVYASGSGRGIALTREQDDFPYKPIPRSVGRVLYETPIHIWDSKKDTIASFQTNFSFGIWAIDETTSASGLAFFLAPVDTQPQYGTGGLLGIFSDVESIEPIVAVEFDTFIDPWDPKLGYHHIGIDINSIKSKKAEHWYSTLGSKVNVFISYDAPTCSLTVSYTRYPHDIETLKESVCLKDFLPPWVRIGFSATTGDSNGYAENNQVWSWSFYSELPDSCNSKLGFKNTNLLSN